MFHSVGLEKHPWAWSYISESIETFEKKIAALKKKGFTGVFWQELYEHMAGRRTLPDNSILLTFDDGYLDNWVHVFPILKKYGMKGTIFMSTDFVDPIEEVRPNLDDVQSGHCGEHDLAPAGFLSWAEMREMERSGLVDIQSHAVTHTWYFSSPKIVGFHEPRNPPPLPWLFWNARPDRKPYYLNEDQQGFLPWGYPVLAHEKSLTATRFFPDEAAISTVVDYVDENGGRDFFDRNDWRPTLEREISSRFENGELPGTYETNDEQVRRVTNELQQSRQLIGRNLEKTVDYICWPGGAVDDSVEKIAQDVGYKSWTLSSRSQAGKRNRPGADPVSIKRIGTSNQIIVKGRHCGHGGPGYQAMAAIAHQGSMLHSAGVKAYKLTALALTLASPK